MATHARIIYLLNGLLVALIALMASMDARAETYAYTGAWSKHIASDYDYNETHNLLAVEHGGYIAGRFDNSFDTETYFAGTTYSTQWLDFEGTLMVGAMYGYKGCKGQQSQPRKTVCPMVAPAVSYTEYSVQPTVFVLGNAVALSVRWEL